MPTQDSDSEDDKAREGFEEALRRIQEARRKGATELDLSSLGLTSVPVEVRQLAELKEFESAAGVPPAGGCRSR